MVIVRVKQSAKLATTGVRAVVRPLGQHQQQPEILTRGPSQLLYQDVDHFRRPQELVLQVDERLGATQSIEILLQNGEVATRGEAVSALWNGARQLHGSLAGRGRGHDGSQFFARHLLPALREVAGDVRDDRAAQFSGRVVPAQRAIG